MARRPRNRRVPSPLRSRSSRWQRIASSRTRPLACGWTSRSQHRQKHDCPHLAWSIRRKRNLAVGFVSSTTPPCQSERIIVAPPFVSDQPRIVGYPYADSMQSLSISLTINVHDRGYSRNDLILEGFLPTFSAFPALGQTSETTHRSQAGARAVHTLRP